MSLISVGVSQKDHHYDRINMDKRTAATNDSNKGAALVEARRKRGALQLDVESQHVKEAWQEYPLVLEHWG